MDDPEFYEAFNAKIKIEEDLLKNLGMYSPIGYDWFPTEEDWTEIIVANWNDVYHRLYERGESYGAIAKTDLEKRIPDEKDRELYYMGLWVPPLILHYSPSTDWGQGLVGKVRDPNEEFPRPEDDSQMYQRIPYESPPYGRERVVENIRNLPKLAALILQAHEDNELLLHHRSRYYRETIPDWAFPYSSDTHKKFIDCLYMEDEELEMIIFIHGLSMCLYAEDRMELEQILYKSLGLVAHIQRAPYNQGELNKRNVTVHGEPALVIPWDMLEEIRADPVKYGTPIIGPGQSIGWVANLESAEKDGIPFLRFQMPNGIILIVLDDEYELLSWEIEPFRRAGYEPDIWTIEELRLERDNLE